MTVFSQTQGLLSEKTSQDVNNSDFEEILAPNTKATVESVWVCNKSGGSVTVDLIKRSGSDHYYFKGASISTGGTEVLNGHLIVLQPGDKLMAKAGSASALDISVTYYLAKGNA